MPTPADVVESLLKSKFGFTAAPNKSDDHKWFELKPDGLPRISTKISHGERDIGITLEDLMAKQMGVTRSFFVGMFRCKNSSEAYLRFLRTTPTGNVLSVIELERKRAEQAKPAAPSPKAKKKGKR